MRPDLTPGDRVVVLRLRPRPGDVVALRDPREPERTIVKRVLAVDGAQLTVLGDNAEASTDSRTFGPVLRSSVLGRVVYRYAPTERAGRLSR